MQATKILLRTQVKLSKRKVSWFTGFHFNVGKTFAYLVIASSVVKETHCSKDSSGKLNFFVENPQKPQNFLLTVIYGVDTLQNYFTVQQFPRMCYIYV